jgi:pimeloyl-ACP methyl ester carboxylesterase
MTAQYIAEEASGNTVLFVPGLLCGHAVWSAQIDALSGDFDCRVAQLDTQDAIDAMASAVLALSDGAFSLVGHSMGGYVALEVMRRAPQRVQRLALLSTQPRADSPEQAARRERLFQDAQLGGFQDVIAGFPSLLFHESRLSDPSVIDAFDAMARRVDKEAFLRQQRAIMGRVDSLADLSTIACPTLVLCGRQDLITPLENSQLMAGSIPGAALITLEDCGHMAPMERPAAVNAALREWLERSH